MKIKILLAILLPFYNSGQLYNKKEYSERVNVERVNSKQYLYFGVVKESNLIGNLNKGRGNYIFSSGTHCDRLLIKKKIINRL